MKIFWNYIFVFFVFPGAVGCSSISEGLSHATGGMGDKKVYSYTILIEGGNPYVYARQVGIDVHPGEAIEMRFSNDKSNWSPWEAVSTNKNWELSESNVVKTVYAEFCKPDGTIYEASDTAEFVEKLVPFEINENDLLGSSLACNNHGQMVAVGAENSKYTNAMGFSYRPGKVVIFSYDGVIWHPRELSLNGATEGDRFGASVSMDDLGQKVAVGSPGYDSERGRVLLFKYNSFSNIWDCIGSVEGEANSLFGSSLSMSKNGNYLVVGAPNGNNRRGEAVLYSLNDSGLHKIDTFTADSPEEEDCFGCTVAINGDGTVFVVGADHKKSGVYTNSGIAYVFRKVESSYVKTELESNDRDYNLFFANSASISRSGDVICLGAKGYLFQTGRVYAYRYDSQSKSYEEYPIFDEDGNQGDQFGFAVALSSDGNTVVAGAPYFDDLVNRVNDTGKISIFSYSNSIYVKTSDRYSLDKSYQKLLGYSLAINALGTLSFAGSIGDVLNSTMSGSVYVFRD